MSEEQTASKKIRTKLNQAKRARVKHAKFLVAAGKANANKPSHEEVRKFRSAMKKHLKDPLDCPKPRPLRGEIERG